MEKNMPNKKIKAIFFAPITKSSVFIGVVENEKFYFSCGFICVPAAK